MSSSPAAKRNLKPTPIAASPPNAHFTTQTDMQAATPGQQEPPAAFVRPPTPSTSRKRKGVNPSQVSAQKEMANIAASGGAQAGDAPDVQEGDVEQPTQEPKPKKSRTNTVQPWSPAEEQRLKVMRDAGNSWSEIAKTFTQRTEGSVKKHWYKDMHYAEFAEDESAALLSAIKEYDSKKWVVIGQKVGKPAKACEQYAKEHFGGKG